MREISILLDILCTLNEGFWLYRFPDIMYERRNAENQHAKLWFWGFVLCFTVMVKILNWVAVSSPYTIFILIPCTISIVLFWKCSVIDAFSVCGGYIFVNALVGTIEISITGILGGEELIRNTAMVQGKERCIYLLIGGPIWFVLNHAFSKWLIYHKEQKEKFNKYIIIVTAVGLGGASFFTLSMLSEFSYSDNMGWYLFLTILAIIILSYYFYIKREQMQDKIHLLDIQNSMLERNYESVTAFYAENAKLYHDMNHHLDAIGQMLQAGHNQEAVSYIESLREPLKSSKISVRTGIDVIDTVLYEAEQRARKKEIIMEMKIQSLPQDMLVAKKDICALFANILDNAIDAADKEIYMSVKKVYGMLLIELKNDYSVRPIKKNNRFVTSKQDYNHHGWGMQIIEQIVEKYDGSIEYELGDKFRVEIMINI